MKIQLPISSKSQNDNTVFCTECGTKLDEYCFDEESDNIHAIRKHHEQCKVEERFKGDKCSRLFIAEDTEPINFIDPYE